MAENYRVNQVAKELLEMVRVHQEVAHYGGCGCEKVLERMVDVLLRWRSEQQRIDDPIVQTTKDIEDWLEHINRTAQITYRVKLSPSYLVRIVKDPERHEGTVPRMYVQATGNSLEEAFERCLEAYLDNGWVPEEHSGHLGKGQDPEIAGVSGGQKNY